METKLINKEEKHEKELRALVSRIKNETTALNKILAVLKNKEEGTEAEQKSADSVSK